MEGSHSTLTQAILAVYSHRMTSILSLDTICGDLQIESCSIENNKGLPILSSGVTRRKVSSILSSSELFIRAGPPRSCLWALRPKKLSQMADSMLQATIEQSLVENGPTSLSDLYRISGIENYNLSEFEVFVESKRDLYEKGDDGLLWFTGLKRPERNSFCSVIEAITYALKILQKASTIEEIYRTLCLSTIMGPKLISRRKVSRELSRRSDLFSHVSRAKYELNCKSLLENDEKSLELNQCQYNFHEDEYLCITPPTISSDFFDPSEFFSIGTPYSF